MKLILLNILLVLCFVAQGPIAKGAYVSNVLEDYFYRSSKTDEDLARDAEELCSDFILSQPIQPKLTKVEFQLRTNTTSESFPLTELDDIVTSENFDMNKKLVVYLSGWLIGLPRSGQVAVERAYHTRNDTNFVATDTTHMIKTMLQWSLMNAEEIGEIVGSGLARLVQEKNYPLEKIHLIGHSLGVILAGKAGQHFKRITGKSIPRITGLDPANGCVDGKIVAIQMGSADFIDIIHSNPGGIGEIETHGNVDFYAGGLNTVQPGCRMLGCSHIRACLYYAESVHRHNENNFLSAPCSSMEALKDPVSCKGSAIPMGYRVPLTAKGIYYLEVNSKSPYGKNDSYVEDDGNGGNNLSNNWMVLTMLFSLCCLVTSFFK